jgi:hypothetical protein
MGLEIKLHLENILICKQTFISLYSTAASREFTCPSIPSTGTQRHEKE